MRKSKQDTKIVAHDDVIGDLLHVGVDAIEANVSCPVARFLDAFDGPWATLIIRELLTGPKRFGELRKELSGASPKTLSARLKHLSNFGVLTRTDHGGVPPKVVYELTPAGQSLAPILNEMAKWANAHLPDDAARSSR